MKQVKGQPMCMKTKANPHSHQKQVMLVKKDLLFGVISLLLKGGWGEEPKAACNYCGTTYACDSKLNDTTAMKTHIQSQCLKYPYRKEEKNQSTLAFKPKEEGESCGRLVPHVFNFEACKKAMVEMIILDELSFRFVEGLYFRRFMSVA